MADRGLNSHFHVSDPSHELSQETWFPVDLSILVDTRVAMSLESYGNNVIFARLESTHTFFFGEKNELTDWRS